MELPTKLGGFWLSAALEHIRDGVIGVDRAGGVVWMNPAAERLTGRQEIDATGRRVDDIFNVPKKGYPLGASVQTVINSGRSAHESCRELFGTGTRPVRVDYTIAPVFQSGECRGAVIVLSEHAFGSGPDTGARPEKFRKKPYAPEQGRAWRVLVMDDDDVVRNLTVQKLIRLGYESEGASNGEEAVFKFRAARDSGKPFDVVILDLIVRGGMGGKATLEMLRKVDPDVRAVLTSGHAADPVLTNFWEHGFFGVVRKPFVLNELDAAIREALTEE